MALIRTNQQAPITLKLSRDLVRSLKRGHPWVFAEALQSHPQAPRGTPARLLDKAGRREIALGFYDPDSPLAFRVCHLNPDQALDDAWAARQMARAWMLRQSLFDEQTTGYRLFNGEGDGLPGLVCDIYGETAVIRLDGEAPTAFWDTGAIAEWVADTLALRCIYERKRVHGKATGRLLMGSLPTSSASFLENGIQFTADIVYGQKTGFFLDQRQNRQQIGRLAADKRVLNVFGYTGGFSVYAGLGGAEHVTTVDSARPALNTADYHWQLNRLSSKKHATVAVDAFSFLVEMVQEGRQWDLVIIDPPSFAPSKKSTPKALASYRNLAAAGAAITKPDGLLAMASCSSHVDLATFLDVCEEGVSKSRRRATILSISGQPPDHPAPLVAPELRYLKFVLMRID